MTREIKFRAWHLQRKKFIERSDVLDNVFPVIPDGKNFILDQEHVLLQQFTGLLDKNGKEIYEGDILLIQDEEVVPITDEGQGPLEACNHIVKVEFRDGCFGFEIPKNDDGETGWFTWDTWSEIDDPQKIEIIGNIYENSNLLK